MHNYIGMLPGNKVLNVSFIAWLIAQIIKIVFVIVKTRKLDFRLILSSGGMPSSHSAAVMACSTSIFKYYGFTSPYFGISIVFSFVVMYDAANVRRSAGEQAKILNYMMEHWSETTPDMFGKELKELLGHTPFEVFMGAILGIVLGFLA